MPDRKGTVSGFVVAGFGSGAAVFDMVATAVVNPNDAPPDPVTGYYGEVRVGIGFEREGSGRQFRAQGVGANDQENR